MFDFLYAGDRKPLNVPNYSAPEMLPHAEWVHVAHCPKVPADGDGQSVDVYEQRLPATCFKLVVNPDPNSGGGESHPINIGFGSSAHAHVEMLVEQITSGMIGFHPYEPHK